LESCLGSQQTRGSRMGARKCRSSSHLLAFECQLAQAKDFPLPQFAKESLPALPRAKPLFGFRLIFVRIPFDC